MRPVDVLVLSGLLAAPALAVERPLIFPLPQKLTVADYDFPVDENVPILVPRNSSPSDQALARLLAAELGDRYGIGIRVESTAAVPAGRRFILMGSLANPLVRQQADASQLQPPTEPESYCLQVRPESILIAGRDEQGAFYGLQSLRQLIAKYSDGVRIRGVRVDDKPHLPFRAIRLYVPGRENIAFFKRFLSDFMALYKFNNVIIEMNASMRLDRHPELNAGWIEFAKDLYYTQRYSPRGPNQVSQNSAHHDAGDGDILEKSEVADLVDYARRLHIDVIPEIPTLTHTYYLLTRHKRFGAITGAEWPDTYCPTDAGIYQLVFDVLDEYIEVMKPRMIHIGHDEMFFPLEACHCCVDKNISELYAYDIRTINDYLRKKGIKVGIYGDHLIESVRGQGPKAMKSPTGWEYHMPGALTPEQVKELIPKDIIVFNWFWQDARAREGRGEPNDVKLSDWGFQQSYINFTPFIDNWGRRSGRTGIIGGSPSSWSATNEYTFGKDLMVAYLGTSNLMWSSQWPDSQELNTIVQMMLPAVRRNLRGRATPAENGDPLVPLDLSPAANSASVKDKSPVELPVLKPGTIGSPGKQFAISPAGAVVVGTDSVGTNALPRASDPISVSSDVSSIVFLHGAARGAANDMSYRYIHNFPDTADLLGWYEVVYEDEFRETVPVRFGVNILPLTWGKQPDSIAKGNIRELSYAYEADMVEHGDHTLFAYEWVNPRFGKVVKEIRLHGTSGFRDTKGNPTPDNAVILAAVSVVKKRPAPPSGAQKR